MGPRVIVFVTVGASASLVYFRYVTYPEHLARRSRAGADLAVLT